MMELIILAWLAIVGGDLAARRSGNQWMRLFCFLGSALLTWAAWPAQPAPIMRTAHAASIQEEVLGVSASDTYHRPGCPALQEIRYVSAEAAEMVGRRPCRHCLRKPESEARARSLGPPKPR